MPLPYSDCILGNNIGEYKSDLVKIFYDHNLEYTQENCLIFCYKRYMAKICDCYDVTLKPETFGVKPCATLEEFLCHMDQFRYFFRNKTQLEECKKEC